jgi:prepilin-type N-terminal cleavage/methylation domain-containing protein
MRSRLALSLIEVLVVLAILAVLAGLSLAGVQRMREAARATECRNHLKQIGLAMQQHHDGCGNWQKIAQQEFPQTYPSEGPVRVWYFRICGSP